MEKRLVRSNESDMSTKIIKIAYCLSGLDGGVGNLIINYFKQMPKSEYIVDIIAQGPSNELYMEQYKAVGFNVYLIPTKKESLFKNLSSLYKLMRSNNYDIVHANMTLTNFFPLSVAAMSGIKVRISHSHQACKHNIKSLALAYLSKIVATDYIACGTEAGKYLFGKSEFKILKNAIELEKYKFDNSIREKERELIGIKPHERLIGHIGRFTWQKNHALLIDIFEEIHKRNINVKLLLIGEGELEESIKEHVKQKGLEDFVIFCGVIPDVNCKLQAMDLFILPSLYEGLSIAAIEAQASGTPCIFSSAIGKETKVADNVKFINSSASIDEWSRICLEKLNMSKTDNSIELATAGYDISIEANKLDQYYKEIIL